MYYFQHLRSPNFKIQWSKGKGNEKKLSKGWHLTSLFLVLWHPGSLFLTSWPEMRSEGAQDVKKSGWSKSLFFRSRQATCLTMTKAATLSPCIPSLHLPVSTLSSQRSNWPSLCSLLTTRTYQPTKLKAQQSTMTLQAINGPIFNPFGQDITLDSPWSCCIDKGRIIPSIPPTWHTIRTLRSWHRQINHKCNQKWHRAPSWSQSFPVFYPILSFVLSREKPTTFCHFQPSRETDSHIFFLLGGSELKEPGSIERKYPFPVRATQSIATSDLRFVC